MTRSLDTSVLVRLCVDDVPVQVKAANRLLDSGEPFEIADAAVIETAYVLLTYYRLPRTIVAETLVALLQQPNLRCDQALFAQALAHFTKYPKLSFTDCYLAAYAAVHQATPLLTFDKKLAEQSPHAELLQV